MENTIVNRRQLLKGMGLATLGGGAIAALTPTAALAENGEGSSSVVGPWKITIAQVVPAAVTTQGLAVFNPGGGLETTDTGQPGVGLGRWDSDEDQFRGTFNAFSFDPASQQFRGTVEVRFKGRVVADSLSGGFTFAISDPHGNPVPGLSGSGTISGTRFQVKPL